MDHIVCQAAGSSPRYLQNKNEMSSWALDGAMESGQLPRRGVFTGWPDIWRITMKNVVHLQAEYKLRTAYNTLHVVMTGFRKTLYRWIVFSLKFS